MHNVVIYNINKNNHDELIKKLISSDVIVDDFFIGGGGLGVYSNLAYHVVNNSVCSYGYFEYYKRDYRRCDFVDANDYTRIKCFGNSELRW